MHVDTAEFRALRDQVNELAARLEDYRRLAYVAEFALEHMFETGRAYERQKAGQGRQLQRPRHLQSVDGGAS